MRPGLFREEVLQRPHARTFGNVVLITPPSVAWLATAALAVALLLIAFACWGEYTRKVHVAGYLALDKGAIKVFPPLTGTLIEKHVTEGQDVRQGETLYVVSSDRFTNKSESSQSAELAQLTQRKQSYLLELNSLDQINALQQTQLQQRATTAARDLELLDTELRAQRSRVIAAQKLATRFETLAKNQYVAALQAQQKRDEAFDQQTKLNELERHRLVSIRAIEDIKTEIESAEYRTHNQRAEIERTLASLEQERLALEAQRVILVQAPATGRVTAILAQQGEVATPSQALLTILPAGATLEANLLVPSRAIGFLAPGQNVALHYQAFPFQRFGSHAGNIVSVSKTILSSGDGSFPVAISEPVYRVTVKLSQQSLPFAKQDLPLQTGMVLDADIWLEKRSILRWIFDSFYSATSNG